MRTIREPIRTASAFRSLPPERVAPRSRVDGPRETSDRTVVAETARSLAVALDLNFFDADRRYFGQDASILFSASVVLSPRIHCVICVQNVPAPTEAGMASEPSKRNVELGSVSSCTESWSIGSVKAVLSTFWFADTQPECTLARAVAQSPLAR